MRLRSRSLTGRTLFQVAIGVSCIIVLASATTYYLLAGEMERRTVDELRRTVVARGRAEGEIYLLGRDMQQSIRRDLVAKYPGYLNRATLKRFDALYVRTPDGAIRTRPELAREPDSVSGWVRRDTPVNDEFRQRLVLFHDICEQYKAAALPRFEDIYIVAPEPANVGTDPPGLPKWAQKVPADYDQSEENWAQVANPARDPARATVWISVDFDPVWNKLLSAVATPIDIDGRHIGTIYNDLLLDQVMANRRQPEIPGAKHAVFSLDGILISDTDRMDAIYAAKGAYHIDARRDAALASMLQKSRASAVRPISGYDAREDLYFAIGEIAGPGWSYASMLPGAAVRSQAFRSAQWVLWSGLASLALLLAVLAGILRRQIAQPLGQLTRAAEQIASGEAQPVLERRRRDELGRLAIAFADMAQRIAERDAALRQEKRDLEEAMASLRDSEERSRAMTEALHQSEKLASMGSLLAGVAHELNNPLSVVTGRAMMLESAARDEATLNGVRKLRAAAERCERIVKTFLAMARQRQPQRQMVGIQEIIDTALDVLDYTLQVGEVQVKFERGRDIPHICADPDQLHQVFINLIVNAQQAMLANPHPRTLRIVTRHLVSEASVEITLSDSGPGIPEDIRPRIFDPYFTTKPTGEGTGVGLSVSLGIVQAHGGTLTVSCPAQGGATFTVSLPLARTVVRGARHADPHVVGNSNQKVLPAGTPASTPIDPA